MNDSQKLDSRGFIFLDDHNRPFRCSADNDQPWLYYWHPNNNWVTLRPVTQAEIRSFPRNLTEVEQDMYRSEWEKSNQPLNVETKSVST